MESTHEGYGGERPRTCLVGDGCLTTQTLNDEILSLNVELSGMSQNNAALKADNASLLQRWLDKMNMTAEEMNYDFQKEAEVHGETKKEGKARDFQAGGKI